MRFYFDKANNSITIVSGPNEKCPSVTFVEDRGPGRHVNFFGNEIGRYRYHWSSIDEGYSSNTNKIQEINPKNRVCLYKVRRVKTKVKL